MPTYKEKLLLWSLLFQVAQNYVVPHRPGAIDTKVAKHLACAYGDRCGIITKIAETRKLGKRIVRGHPIIEAEVVYAVHNEYCQSVVDFIARRTRLAFLDARAATEAIDRVRHIMLECCYDSSLINTIRFSGNFRHYHVAQINYIA